MLTFCLDPLAEMLQQEINRKRIGKSGVQKGTRLQINTMRVKHIDMFDIATPADKLISSGIYTVNMLLRALGEPQLSDEWANQHFITKNYSTIQDFLEETEQERRWRRCRNQLTFAFNSQQESHKLYIYDDVTAYGTFDWTTWTMKESETSAKYFRDQLEAIPDTATIELHINSNGGSVKEGVAIYTQLKQKGCKKVGYVDGVAYSVAFLILQACDERIMGLGTSALVHNMWMSVEGNAKELRKAADDLDVLMESNRKIFPGKIQPGRTAAH